MTYQIRSQKAKGVTQLDLLRQSFEYVDAKAVPVTGPLDASVPIPPDLALPYKTTFARPCPVRPRHGFVDSRIVRDAADLEVLRQQVAAIEPEAEILLMPYQNSLMNAILTPTVLVLGEGHDGATAGKDAVSLALPTTLELDRDLYGLAPTDDPYVEMVWTAYEGDTPLLTQVRGGPRINTFGDTYIPRDVTVTRIVEVTSDTDMVEWESRAIELGKMSGVVVHHEGGSISSHFGVHCVLNDLAYTIEEAPNIGAFLCSNIGERVKWGQEELDKVALYIRRYSHGVIGDAKGASLSSLAKLGMVALHGLPSLLYSHSDASLRLMAAGIVGFSRVVTALPLGEIRHMLQGTIMSRKVCTLVGAELPTGVISEYGSSLDRDEVYEGAEKFTLDQCLSYLAAAQVGFDRGGWSGGYGGQAWSECASGSSLLVRHAMDFAINPKMDTLHTMLSTFNMVVNLQHNGGWWLNKIMTREEADQISNWPARGMLSPGMLRLVHRSPKASPFDTSMPMGLEDHMYDDLMAEISDYYGTLKPGEGSIVPLPCTTPISVDWAPEEDNEGRELIGVIRLRGLEGSKIRWQLPSVDGFWEDTTQNMSHISESLEIVALHAPTFKSMADTHMQYLEAAVYDFEDPRDAYFFVFHVNLGDVQEEDVSPSIESTGATLTRLGDQLTLMFFVSKAALHDEFRTLVAAHEQA